jgi:signal transduction histidine kinase
MLSNLLNNSIEAVGVAGSVSLNTSVKSNSVHILIQDDGPGIPLSVIERLGERGNTSGKASGTGLGLAHAVATAKKFGGTLKVTAPEFGGTIIQITLPAISPGASI